MPATSIPSATRWAAAGLVLAGVLFQALWLGLPAIFVSVGLVISYLVWMTTDWTLTPRLRSVFFLTIPVFAAHGLEEYSNGFQQELPALFGRPPVTGTQFLVFNGVWMAVFCITALTLRPGRQLPVVIVLFLALVGGVGNGIIHLGLVLQRGSYFPGAWTAPLCFVVGVWLLKQLYFSGGSSRVPAG